MVTLDNELGRAIGLKQIYPGQQMARDELFNKLRAGVSWLVSVGGVVKWVLWHTELTTGKEHCSRSPCR